MSTSAWGASGTGLREGNGPLYTAQVILLPAEVSLKSISCGIINSFRSIKGPVHPRGQTDRPKRLLFTLAPFLKGLNDKEEMPQKRGAEGPFHILCFAIILVIERGVCSRVRRTDLEKTPQEFSLAPVFISIPVLYLAIGTVSVA